MPTTPQVEQLAAAVAVVREVLGDSVVAVYLYGSAVMGGLRPNSDLDLFVVASRPTISSERRQFVALLTPISLRAERPATWRPLEVTVVVASDVKPWHFPPRTDFQHGEWLRDRYAEGKFDPEKPQNPDLALLIAMARSHGQALLGPPPSNLLDEVPEGDLVLALTGVIPDLLTDLADDTSNVLLTLARVWQTLETGKFATKDAAADWALTQLPAHAAGPLVRARDVYLGTAEDGWNGLQSEASTTVNRMVGRIKDAADRA